MEFSDKSLLQETQNNKPWEKEKMLNLFSQFERDFKEINTNSVTNLSNKLQLEKDEEDIRIFNENNRELLSEMGTELYLHRLIKNTSGEYGEIAKALLGQEKIQGDLNSFNLYGLKLDDGKKFADFVNKLTSRLGQIQKDKKGPNEWTKDESEEFDKIWDFIDNSIFAEFDFLENYETAMDPSDSFFEFLKSSEGIIKAYKRFDEEKSERLLNIYNSIKHSYYKEYMRYRHVLSGDYSVKRYAEEYTNPEMAENLDSLFSKEKDFKERWEYEIHHMCFENGFEILEKISENEQSLQDNFLLEELVVYKKLIEKSLKVHKKYYSNQHTDILDKLKLFTVRYEDLLTTILNKNGKNLSEQKILQIKNLSQETKDIANSF